MQKHFCLESIVQPKSSFVFRNRKLEENPEKHQALGKLA